MTTKKTKRSAATKSSGRRRTRTVERSQVETAAFPGSEHDSKGRMGDFTGAGEHARIGGRTSGVVGQTTKTLHTDMAKRPK